MRKSHHNEEILENFESREFFGQSQAINVIHWNCCQVEGSDWIWSGDQNISLSVDGIRNVAEVPRTIMVMSIEEHEGNQLTFPSQPQHQRCRLLQWSSSSWLLFELKVELVMELALKLEVEQMVD
jgi:hypothetical protein